MYSILIACALASGVFSGLFFPGILGWGFSLALSVAAFVVAFILIQRLFKGPVMAVQAQMQERMAQGQAQIQSKVQRLQMRINSMGALKQAQTEVERDQRRLVEEALAYTKGLERFVGWIPLMDRQIASMRLQFYWALKDYAKVDELMDKALMVDPMLVAIKIARLYQRDVPSEQIAKVYASAVRRIRYNAGVPVFAVWSWILVKRNDIDGAFKVLTEAIGKTDNAVLKANHSALQNNRVTAFSNQSLGEQWFMLHLEEPRIRPQRARGFSPRH